MTTSQFIDTIRHGKPVAERFAVLERCYKASLSDEARIVSSLESPVFWDGREVCRLMSLSEIAHAASDLHVDFTKLGLIPFFDRGDNNFIVYMPGPHQWAMFNIHDETLWEQGQPLQKLLP